MEPPRYVKEPETDKRQSRANPEAAWVVTEVPHLRIVDVALWDKVKARQTALDARAVPARDGSTFQSKPRARYVFSGLVRCGACGGGVSMISATHLGCSNARNKGETVCTSKRTVKRADWKMQSCSPYGRD